MNPRHDHHTNRTNRSWNPRTEPTARQSELLALWKSGMDRRGIEEAMGITPRTLRGMVANLVEMGAMTKTASGYEVAP